LAGQLQKAFFGVAKGANKMKTLSLLDPACQDFPDGLVVFNNGHTNFHGAGWKCVQSLAWLFILDKVANVCLSRV
jgi:hypothetical protein